MAALIKDLESLVIKYPGVDWLLTDDGVFPCRQVTNAWGQSETHVSERAYVILNENTFETIVKDTETQISPSHILDHNYAKQPRDPEAEREQRPRKRIRKKRITQAEDEWSARIQRLLNTANPRINIIRHSLPETPSYTKLLKSQLIMKPRAKRVCKPRKPQIPEVFNEDDLPQLGALVTLNTELPAVRKSAETIIGRTRRKGRPRSSSTALDLSPEPVIAETEDHLGDEKTAAEYFLDNMFKLERPDELELEMDFSEIQINAGTANGVFTSIGSDKIEFGNIHGELAFESDVKPEFPKTEVDLDTFNPDSFNLSSYSSHLSNHMVEIELTDHLCISNITPLISTNTKDDNHSNVPILDVMTIEKKSSSEKDSLEQSSSNRRSKRESKIPKRHQPYFLSLGTRKASN